MVLGKGFNFSVIGFFFLSSFVIQFISASEIASTGTVHFPANISWFIGRTLTSPDGSVQFDQTGVR